jgi:hypothetical protein
MRLMIMRACLRETLIKPFVHMHSRVCFNDKPWLGNELLYAWPSRVAVVTGT